MEQAKKLWALVLAHKKISIAVAVVVVLIIIASQDFMLDGILKREYSCDLRTDQERVSL